MNRRLLEKNRSHMSERELCALKSREVEKRIRLRYSVSDELAILRQRDEKPLEFAAYHMYAEECKRDVAAALSEGEV
jgi:hypothetical protein